MTTRPETTAPDPPASAAPVAAGLPEPERGHARAVVDAALMQLSGQSHRTPTAAQRAPTVSLAGLPIAAVTEAEAIASIIGSLDRGEGGWVVTPNVDQLRKISRDERMRALAREADFAVADGMPLIWSSRLAGDHLPERVAGSSLIWTLSGAAAARGASVFLLGGDAATAAVATDALRATYPSLTVAGTHSPPFGFEDDAAEMAAIRSAVATAQPDIVFVCLGFPKQERLIRELRTVAPGAWFLGVGAALSFVAGETSRAPRWMQRSGLEWIHRLLSEPRRLFRRYVLEDIPFVLPMLARALGVGVRRRLARAR